MQSITLKSDHGTAVVKPRGHYLTPRQVRRAQRALGARTGSRYLGHENRDVLAQIGPDGSAEIYLRTELEAELLAEVERRGGETGINHAPSQGCSASRTTWRQIEICSVGMSEGRMVVLLRAEGWRYYSRRFGSRPAAVAYLGGYDDNGPWAARVPGTVESATEAVRWLEPSDVQAARSAGRRVLRQGDVYAVETPMQHDGSRADDIDGHTWYQRARVLIHGDLEHHHSPLVVPFPARFLQQRAYRMGRSGLQGAAD